MCIRDSSRPLTSTPTSSVSGGMSGDETPDSSSTIPTSLVCAENYLTITEVSMLCITEVHVIKWLCIMN